MAKGLWSSVCKTEIIMNRNYSKELEQILALNENKGKKLFLHSCCAPCSSYVLEYLRPFFALRSFTTIPISVRKKSTKKSTGAEAPDPGI